MTRYWLKIFKPIKWMAYIAVALLYSTPAFSQSGPTEFSLAGGLYYPNGTPITLKSVDFKVEILDPSNNCVLYQELHNDQDLSNTRGGFALQVGAGTNAVNNVAGGSVLTTSVFENNGVTAVAGCGSVNLSSGDNRLIRVSYDLGSGFVAMNPTIPMTSSAYAMVAESVQGKRAADLVQIRNDNSTYYLGQSNIEWIFNSTNWPRLQDLLNGTSSQYMVTSPSADVSFNNRKITNVAAPTANSDAATKQYADGTIGGFGASLSGIGLGSGEGSTLVWDSVDNRWEIGLPNATDTTKLPLAGGTMSGAITMDGNDIANVGQLNDVDQIYNVGHITMRDQSLLRLGSYTSAQEGLLALGTGNAGTMFFNSDLNQLRFWNGTDYSGIAPGGAASGDLTGAYPNPTIADSAVNSAKIADGAVTSDDIADGTIATADIGNNQITSAKLNNSGIAVNRLLMTDASTGATVAYATCAQDETLKFNSSTGWGCSSAVSLIGDTGVTAGNYGSATSVGTFSVDAQGRLTSASNVAINFPVTSVAGKTGDVSLNTADVAGLGTAAVYNVGTAGGEIPVLDSSARIPAVDGGLLTNVNAVRLQGRTLSSASPNDGQVLRWNNALAQWEPQAIPSAPVSSVNGKTGVVTIELADILGAGDITEVNTGNGLLGGATSGVANLSVNAGTSANQIVQLGSDARIPALDGSLLTNLNALRIQGQAVSAVAPSNNQVLRYNSTSLQWEAQSIIDAGISALTGDVVASGPGSAVATISNNAINSAKISNTGIAVNRILITDATTGATVTYATCAQNEILKFNSSTGWGCAPDAGLTAAVTSLSTGTGLLGGPVTSIGTISVDVGTSANQIVQLGSDARIPALDGSLLSNLNAVRLQGRTVSSSNPAPNQLLVWNGSQWEPQTSAVANAFLQGGNRYSSVATLGTNDNYRLDFETNNTARMSIDTTGNVGIGTTTPISPLMVSSSITNAPNGLSLGSPSSSNVSHIWTGTPGNYDGFLKFGINPVNQNDFSVAVRSTGIFLPSGNSVNLNGSGSVNSSDGGTNFRLSFNGGAYTTLDSGTYISLKSGGQKEAVRIAATGSVGIGTISPTAGTILDLNGTGTAFSSVIIPRDTAALRPTVGVNGMIRYNTTTQKFEAFEGEWKDMISSAAGGADITDVVAGSGLLGGASSGAATLSVQFPMAATSDGTAAAPAYSFSGDSDNGMFKPSTNSLALSTFGTQRMTIDSGGNVGIGTATPVQRLDIVTGGNGDGTANEANAIRIRGSAVAGNTITMQAGVNTTAVGGSNIGYAYLQSTYWGGANTPLLLNPKGGPVSINQTRGHAPLDVVGAIMARPTSNTAGAESGRIGFSFNNYGGTATPAYVAGVNEGSLYSGLGLVFGTANNGSDVASTDGTERMRITSTGRVGIGTTSPTAGTILDLNGTGNAFSSVIVPRDTTALRPTVGVNGMIRYNTSTQKFEVYEGAWKDMITPQSAPSFPLLASPDGTAAAPAYSFSGDADNGMFKPSTNSLAFSTFGTQRLTIDTSGNVGIGTSSPSAKFSVVGAWATGDRAFEIKDNSGQELFSIYANGGNANTLYLRGWGGATIRTNDNESLTIATSGSAPQIFSTGYAERMRITSAGNVGIGTNNPATALEVNGTITGKKANFSDEVSIDTVASMQHALTLTSTGGGHALRVGNGSSFYISSGGTPTLGSNNLINFAHGSAVGDPNQIITDGGTGLGLKSSGSLFVATGGTTRRFVIDTSGNVGINSTSPGAKLDIADTTTTTSAVIVPRAPTFTGTAVNGMIRYNTTTQKFEAFEGSWKDMISSAASGADITDVIAGSGLLGGATSGAATLSVQFPMAATADGTAALPTYSFSSDPDTGMYRSGTNELAFAVQGTQRLRFDPNGKSNFFADVSTEGGVLYAQDLVLTTAGDFQQQDTNATSYFAGRLTVGANTVTTGARLDVVGTGAAFSSMIIPRDTAANRPTVGVNGMIRYNTTTQKFEAFEGSWKDMISTASSGADITDVIAGNGLLGGATSGAATLSVQFPMAATSNGTAAAPAYSFSGDTDNGMFKPSTNSLAFSTAGTQRLTVSPMGDLGLGTASPEARIEVVQDDGTFLSMTKFTRAHNTAPGSGSAFTLQRSRGTSASPTDVLVDDNLGYFRALGYAASDWRIGAQLNFVTDGPVSATAMPTRIEFATNDTTSGALNPPLVRMTIKNNGRVGIGTTTPTTGTILDLNGTGAAFSSVIVPRDTTALRPTVGVNGMIRYNTTTQKFEAFEGSWKDMISTASSGADITDVVAGSGLLGGATSGAATLSVQFPMAATSNGTAAAPAYSFSGDTDNGMFKPSTNSLAFSTAGTQRLTIDGSGDVGIGTTTPSFKLHVVDSSAAPNTYNKIAGIYSTGLIPGDSSQIAWGVANSSYNQAEMNFYYAGSGSTSNQLRFGLYGAPSILTVQGNGNVGIGTTAPAALLDVNGSMNVQGPVQIATNGLSGSQSNFNFSNTGIDSLLYIRSPSTAYNSNYGLRLQSGAANTISTGAYQHLIVQSGASNTNLLLQTNGGNVGIGTTSPLARFHVSDGSSVASGLTDSIGGIGSGVVYSASNAIDQYILSANSTNQRGVSGMIRARGSLGSPSAVQTDDWLGSFLFGGYDGSQVNFGAGLFAIADGNAGAGNSPTRLSFVTGNNGADRQERLTIKAGGNVGLGTVSPTAGTILDINGTGTAFSSMIIPRDTAANRPTTGVNGMIRYNTTTQKFEAFEGSWKDMISSASSGADITDVIAGSGLLGGATSGAATLSVQFPMAATSNGTAAAPAYSFSGDTDNGMLKPSTNSLAFSTAGTQRLTIDGNGNMGIGTASPLYPLQVAGKIVIGDSLNNPNIANVLDTGVAAGVNGYRALNLIDTGGVIKLARVGGSPSWELQEWDNTISTLSGYWETASVSGVYVIRDRKTGSILERMRIDSSGRVGIGTASPTAGTILDINGTGTAFSSMIIPRDTAANRPTTGVNGMIRYNTTTQKFEAFEGSWKDMISSASSGADITDVIAGSGLLGGATSGAATLSVQFPMAATSDGTAGAPAYSFSGDTDNGMFKPSTNSLAFSTAGTQRLTMDGSGNVSINTIGQTQIRNYTGTANIPLVVENFANNGGAAGIAFKQTNSAGGVGHGIKTAIYATGTGGWGRSDLSFVLDNSATSADASASTDTKMIIKSTGSVGIGTTSPTAGTILDMNGSGTGFSSVIVPRDTTALRPTTGVNGMIRYNTTTQKFEAFEGSWKDMISTASNGADITDVIAGDGLLGGATSGAATLSVQFPMAATSNGTAAAPAYSFSGDTDNGMFKPNTNSLAFSTFGTQRLTMDGSGNVGIGTTAPIARMHVVDENNAGWRYEQYSNVDGTNFRNHRARGTAAAPTGVLAGDRLGSFLGGGYNGSSFSGQNGGLSIFAAENYTSSSTGGTYLTLSTSAIGSNPAGGGTERVRIDSSGSVVIGTTSPTAGTILDVNGTGAAFSSMIIPRDTTGNRPTTGVNGMIRYNTTTQKFEAFEGSWKDIIPTAGSGDITDVIAGNGLLGGATSGAATLSVQFPMAATSNGTAAAPTYSFSGDADNGMFKPGTNVLGFSTAGAQRLTIDGTGFVGIGTTSPTRNLEVVSAFGNSLIYVNGGFSGGSSGIFIDTVGDSSSGRLTFQKGGVTSGGLIYQHAANGGSERLDFNVAGGTPKMAVFGNGSVGIGTTSPTAGTILDVDGTVKVDATWEGVATSANSSASYTIPDLTMNIRRITLTANTTITLPVVTSLAADQSYTLTVKIVQDGTGSRTLAWNGNGKTIKWDGGVAPAHATPANTVTIYQFFFISGESQWYGSIVWREN